MIRIAAHQRGQIERHAQPGATRGQQRLVAPVGVFRRAEPSKLPHRPQLAAIAGRMDATRVRERTGVPDVASVVDSREVVTRVETLHRPT